MYTHSLKEKHNEVKRKEAERKRSERRALKINIENHPRKYKGVAEKIRMDTAERVRKHRQAKRKRETEESEETNILHPQKRRRQNENRRILRAEKRDKHEEQKQSTRKRVKDFRLRIKLGAFFGTDGNSPTTQDCSKSPNIVDNPSAYKHKSSESRA